jgi:hypothetical protein
MASQTPISDAFERNKYDLPTAAKQSKTWFTKQIAEIGKQNITQKQLMRSDVTTLTKNITPGQMYMYVYSAKGKDTLPYYDKFPLVFPFKETEGGFLGLNLHYLPYNMRVRLLDALMVFKSNSRLDDTTKLKYSWATIAHASTFAAAQPCIKQYLTNHVASQYRVIGSQDWVTACMLPVENFVGATKQEVWRQSRQKVQGRLQ